MASNPTLFIGIDPCGGRKPFTWAAFDQTGRLVALQNGDSAAALSYVAGQPGAIVAVNAPPRPNSGLVRREKVSSPSATGARSLDMRLAERQLRERGIRVPLTPSDKALCAPWQQAGFEFYQRIESLGFLPYPTPGAACVWLETQAHALFCVLLGQPPLNRRTLEGRQQRQLALYEQGLNIRDPMEFFEEITRHKLLKGILPVEHIYSPEQLDALAAAYTAYVAGRHPARLSRVGDLQEGQIFLPVGELKAKYQ